MLTCARTYSHIVVALRYEYNNMMYRLNLSHVDTTPVPNQKSCHDPDGRQWTTWKIVAAVGALGLFVCGATTFLCW